MDDDFFAGDPAQSAGGLQPLSDEQRHQRDTVIDGHLRRATGVLHLGAHHGQERDEYARRRLPVTWVEAHPIIYRRLAENVGSYDGQGALCALLADVDGRPVDFGRSANVSGESSSMYEFGMNAHALWPEQELFMMERVPLNTTTLDQLLADHAIYAADRDFWVMDLQGAELRALQGAEQSLRSCRALLVEVSTVEVYRGGVQWPELRDHLEGRGFAPAWAPARPHDDVLFVPDPDPSPASTD